MVGEEVVDLRDFEHLLAATADDAYNALVCTRFATELGRERVYQIAPDESSGRHAASREWRGKLAVEADMVYDRLTTLMQGGAAFVVEPVLDDPTDDQGPQAGWPVALVGANGSFTLFSPEQEDVAISGDMVVKLYQPSSTAIVGLKQKRRFAVYRRVAAS